MEELFEFCDRISILRDGEYVDDVEIDTGSGGVESFVSMGAGFNNMSESLNEVVQQYFFLNDEGFARKLITLYGEIAEKISERVDGE